MTAYRVKSRALAAIEDIHRYSIPRWGEDRADAYVLGLFDLFSQIADHAVAWQPVPAAFGVVGYRHRYRRHFVYWRLAADGAVIVMAVLHDRMLQAEQMKASDWDDDDRLDP